jgi:hypothetical protein
MEQSPSWEANSSSDGQEMSRILWIPKIHYRGHKSTPLVPVMSLFESVHTFTPYFFKKHFDITLSSKPKSLKCLVPSWLKFLYAFLYILSLYYIVLKLRWSNLLYP